MSDILKSTLQCQENKRTTQKHMNQIVLIDL